MIKNLLIGKKIENFQGLIIIRKTNMAYKNVRVYQTKRRNLQNFNHDDYEVPMHFYVRKMQ